MVLFVKLSKVSHIMLAYLCCISSKILLILYYSKGQNEKNGSDKSLDQTSANMDMNDQVDSSMYVLLLLSSKSFII